MWYCAAVKREEHVMRAKKFARPKARHAALKATLARLMGQPRFNRLRDMPMLHRFTAPKVQTPDPVLLAVLAIDRVGPAAVRACASGVEVRVAAPDEATATVLRAALTETARRRDTDRLIRIVVG
jgi:hypothetical protein